MRSVLRLVVLVVACTGCGNSATGPSGGTRVEARIQDTAGAPAVTGTLAGNFSAAAWDGSRWVELGSPNGITVPLQSAGPTTVHGEQSISAGSYNRVRLVLQGVTARISRGSIVGGNTLANDANLQIGGGDQRVEIIVSVDSFSVEADPSMRRLIVFDLRSSQWLTTAAVQSGNVDDSSIQSAITASTRAEPR